MAWKPQTDFGNTIVIQECIQRSNDDSVDVITYYMHWCKLHT